jgi:CRISPR/Cas system-associated exonuclease Cas4 (RecB family)
VRSIDEKILTKSDLQSFLQCPRKLWLERHRSDLRTGDDPSVRRRMVDGNMVGEKAREQLGPDFIWPPAMGDKDAAAEEGRRLLDQSPKKPAVEVPMVAGGLYARADAVIPDQGCYVLRETKASNFPLKGDKETPGKPKEHHLNDLAIQAWVMAQCGLPIGRTELNYLNGRWRYPGKNDYSGLFRRLDVTQNVAERMRDVPQWHDSANRALAAEMPKVTTGKQCSDPYECPFQEFCRRLEPPGPDAPIELLPGPGGKSLARKLHEQKGYVSILEPKPGELTGSDAGLYRRIQTAHRTGQAVLAPGSVKVMSAFPYPRYYFDFEAIDLAVPRWRGVRPYEHIPFQWSCHIERSPGVFEHGEFLDLTGEDPSEACIRHMREIINEKDDGPIFVYYASYELGRLKGITERHERYGSVIDTYIERVVDLLPIVKAHYYHPDMAGSFSIKRVLPAIAPDLDYGELDEVQGGLEAQVAYINAALDPEVTSDRKSDLEQKLRRYCRQDSWAMVEIAYFLAEAGRPTRPKGM